jgi:hypothetical protein
LLSFTALLPDPYISALYHSGGTVFGSRRTINCDTFIPNALVASVNLAKFIPVSSASLLKIVSLLSNTSEIFLARLDSYWSKYTRALVAKD